MIDYARLATWDGVMECAGKWSIGFMVGFTRMPNGWGAMQIPSSKIGRVAAGRGLRHEERKRNEREKPKGHGLKKKVDAEKPTK